MTQDAFIGICAVDLVIVLAAAPIGLSPFQLRLEILHFHFSRDGD